MHVGLPDAASIEASKMVDADNDRTVLIDASTAFRVSDEWTYGFPGKCRLSLDWLHVLYHLFINANKFLINDLRRAHTFTYHSCDMWMRLNFLCRAVKGSV